MKIFDSLLNLLCLTLIAAAVLGGLARFADGVIEIYQFAGGAAATLYALLPLGLVLILAYFLRNEGTKKGYKSGRKL